MENRFIDGRRIAFFYCGAKNVPAVYAPVFEGDGSGIFSECQKLGCAPFNLAVTSCPDWDADLSPWPCGKILSSNDNFIGNAASFAEWICGEVIPYAEELFGIPSFRVAAGYSMAGLFSLYAPTVCDKFERIVSASGSLWFPGFVKYIEETGFKSKITKVYLSLGDREKITKNKYMKTVESDTQSIYENFRSRKIETVFEMNPGNHFKDSALRLAKGIKWILN